jgi:hypothetical protein
MSAAAAPTPTEITGAELALLALSNPRDISRNTTSPIALTTKESYVWGILLASLAEGASVIQPKQLVNTIHQEMRKRKIEQLLPSAGLMASQAILKSVAEQLLSPRPDDINGWFEGLTHNADQTYRALIAKDLIEDPLSILLGGVGVGVTVTVLGLIPLSFTRQTYAGEQVLMRITSAFYQYEQTSKGKDKRVDIRFHLFALIRAFSAGASNGFTKAWEGIKTNEKF